MQPTRPTRTIAGGSTYGARERGCGGGGASGSASMLRSTSSAVPPPSSARSAVATMKSSSSGQIQKSVHLMQLSWKAIRWLKPNWTHGQRHERIAEDGESRQEHVPDDQLVAPEVSSALACRRAPSSSSSMMTVSSIAGAIDCMPARADGIFCAVQESRAAAGRRGVQTASLQPSQF